MRDFGHASFPFHRTMFERIAARDPDGARAEALKLIATVEDDLKRGAAQSETCGTEMNEHRPGFDRDYVAEAATLLAHDEPFPGGAVVPPIYQTSLFTFANYAEMADTFAGRRQAADLFARRQSDGHGVRGDGRRAGRRGGGARLLLAAWRRSAPRCWLLSAQASASSRCAIAMATPTGCSSGFLPRLGIKVDYVDGSDPDAVAAALPGAKLLYLESPTSMMFELQDIARI